MSNDEKIQQEIIQIISAEILPETSLHVFQEKLAAYINVLINHNFEKLIQILYRLDISEQKLKSALASCTSDAGVIIAGIIIERQTQKIKTREQYHQQNMNIDDEEKW